MAGDNHLDDDDDDPARLVSGGGCSTLDLLKRPQPMDGPRCLVPGDERLRQEMRALATEPRRARGLREAPAGGARVVVANMATLGERLGRPKPAPFNPGTPVLRKLHGGRMIRLGAEPPAEDSPALRGSRSAPTLPTQGSTVGGQDGPDVAAMPTQSPSQPTATTKATMTVTGRLEAQQTQLQEELLRVTQKLCRKYNKELFPRAAQAAASADAAHARAVAWAHGDALTEAARHRLYMGGRYVTQQERDYYARDLGPREPEDRRHRHATQHSKYGDALARNRASLRAPF